MATFVLVPGGWRGGWYFQRLAEALESRGHRARSLTLTGLAERRHELAASVNLDTHIEDVVRLMRDEQLRDVVLLGHSYGGMVITGVADRVPDRVSAAIYCDAYVPSDGQSCFDLTSEAYRKRFIDGAGEDGFSVQPGSTGDARITPHPLAAFVQRLRLRNGVPSIRRGYIFLNGWDDTPFAPVYERLRAEPDWQSFELPSGHDVMAGAFDELLEILLRFA
jgi:pimeloyl-ACP methyl ester carboxylesterase